MRVRWLRVARDNFDAEVAHVAADDPAVARLVAERIFDAVATLVEFPARGRPGRVPGTRELIVAKTRYVVPYRVRGDRIEILRVFHASRRSPDRW